MSGERPQAPRPRPVEAGASHSRPAQPFLLADDLSPRATLETVQQHVIEMRAEMHARFDVLEPRVEKLEADAAWKAQALRALKYGGPFVAGILTRYAPDAVGHFEALITFARAMMGAP